MRPASREAIRGYSPGEKLMGELSPPLKLSVAVFKMLSKELVE